MDPPTPGNSPEPEFKRPEEQPKAAWASPSDTTATSVEEMYRSRTHHKVTSEGLTTGGRESIVRLQHQEMIVCSREAGLSYDEYNEGESDVFGIGKGLPPPTPCTSPQDFAIDE